MSPRRPLVSLLLATAAIVLPGLAAAPAGAQQENYSVTVTVLGGIGGSVDGEPDMGIENQALQLGAALVTEPRTHLGLRVGRIEGDDDVLVGNVLAPELEYATISGEYKVNQGYYDSGLYIGLGGYRLTGLIDGEEESDTSFGLAIGLTGEFRVNSWLGIQLELSGHWADLEPAQIWGMGHAGVAIHF